MRVTARGEYATQTVLHLAMPYPEVLAIHDIVERHHIPLKYLEQILLELKRGGILDSRRGVHGGYTPARPPNQTPSATSSARLMAHSPNQAAHSPRRGWARGVPKGRAAASNRSGGNCSTPWKRFCLPLRSKKSKNAFCGAANAPGNSPSSMPKPPKLPGK